MKYPVTQTALLYCLLSAVSLTTFAKMTEKKTTLEDQTQVAITIYNKDLALVKDQRNVKLDKGFNYLAFRGVSAKMRPETAMLRSLDHSDGFQVIEQNFDYDLLTPHKLLDKYIGRQVCLATVNPATGKQTIEEATVLSTESGVVLKIQDRIEINPKGQFIFDNIPDNLRDQPTLVTQLKSATSDVQQLELSYLSSGLSWKADYVAELNANDSAVDLLGWVTLHNVSGAEYQHANLQLVAGDVNQVQEEHYPASRKMRSFGMTEESDSMVEESLFEYHLYRLNRPTSLLNNQTKQAALLSANAVPVTKEFVLSGADYYYHGRYGQIGAGLKVGVFVQLDNKQSVGLGMPIPKGVVRVYKKDSKGNAQFIGEDNIDHTPKNETIRLKLGDAFDVTANKKQTDFKKHKSLLPGKNVYDSAFQITLKNAKPEAVTVIVREPIPGDWSILKESKTHKKVSAGIAEWHIKVPPDGQTVLTYRVRIEH